MSDGKAGHDSQSLGLVMALQKLHPCKNFEIAIGTRSKNIFNLILGRFPSGINMPAPDLIIGTGRTTHLPLLTAKHVYGGKTIVIMKPGLPYSWFDYCIIPSHDLPPNRDNIIVSQGALNSLSPSEEHNPDQGMLLIGGPSRHYHWDEDALINQLEHIFSAYPDINWIITNSRRTPATTMKLVTSRFWKQATIKNYPEFSRNELYENLARTHIVWVTEDSVSMVYEALSCCQNVGVLKVPVKSRNKIKSGLETLVKKKLITEFNTWKSTKKMISNPQPLNESLRCATILNDKGIFDK